MGTMEKFESLEIKPNCGIDWQTADDAFAQEFSYHKVLRSEEDGINV